MTKFCFHAKVVLWNLVESENIQLKYVLSPDAVTFISEN